MKNIPLVVTTLHRGVFFGYGEPTTEKTIRLIDARMCVFWSSDIKGVLGLAATGPSATCRITPKVPAMTLQDVTGVQETTEQAAKAWESSPWS